MADSETETQYKQAFIARVAAARQALGWKQWQMAEALDIPQDKYKQYESRSLMPHHMIPRFCLIAHVDMEWMLTGRGQKLPKGLQVVQSAPEKPIPKPKRRAPRAA